VGHGGLPGDLVRFVDLPDRPGIGLNDGGSPDISSNGCCNDESCQKRKDESKNGRERLHNKRIVFCLGSETLKRGR
jgi:hypothetical protein